MKLSRILSILTMLLLSAVMLFAGGSADNHDEHGDYDTIPHIEPVDDISQRPLNVVATTSIIGDVLKAVAGDNVSLSVLIGAGVNPHGYQPNPSDFRRIEEADMVFINGFDLEEQLLDAVKAAATGYVVPVSAAIKLPDSEQEDHEEHPDEEKEDGHDHGGINPHVWFNPLYVASWTAVMEDVLSQADPAHASDYSRNANEYRNALMQLDGEIKLLLAGIVPERRKLVTDHELLSHFSQRYGFETVGTIIPGTSTGTEPSARDIAGLVKLLEQEGIATIFVGETATADLEKLARAISAESGTDIAVVPLLTGALAETGSPGDTYIGFMLENSRRIARALKE